MGKCASKERPPASSNEKADHEETSVLFYKKGVALDSLKKYADALVNFNKAIELDNKYADAYHGKGF